MKTPYENRVVELEMAGLSTSDAQSVATVEFAKENAMLMLRSLESIVTDFIKSMPNSADLIDFPKIYEAMKIVHKAKGGTK